MLTLAWIVGSRLLGYATLNTLHGWNATLLGFVAASMIYVAVVTAARAQCRSRTPA